MVSFVYPFAPEDKRRQPALNIGGVPMNTQLPRKEEVFGLLRRHHDRIRALGVKRLGLFGSFLYGHQGPESDRDILVEFEPGQKTFDNFIQLAFLLEDLLQRKVELVTPEGLSPYIGPHVLEVVEYAAFPG
jgi:predicted nucleotidyltransferase